MCGAYLWFNIWEVKAKEIQSSSPQLLGDSEVSLGYMTFFLKKEKNHL